MIKKLTRHGNTQAFTVDKTMMQLLGVATDTPFQVEIDAKNKSITFRALNPAEKKKLVKETAQKMMHEHSELLEKLAK